jgi:hypothetical protein
VRFSLLFLVSTWWWPTQLGAETCSWFQKFSHIYLCYDCHYTPIFYQNYRNINRWRNWYWQVGNGALGENPLFVTYFYHRFRMDCSEVEIWSQSREPDCHWTLLDVSVNNLQANINEISISENCLKIKADRIVEMHVYWVVVLLQLEPLQSWCVVYLRSFTIRLPLISMHCALTSMYLIL